MYPDMLKEAIAGKMAAAEYYEQLTELATAGDDREILRDIRMDEQKHIKIFTDICVMLMGSVPVVAPKQKQISKNAPLEYARGAFSELESVEFCRKLYFAQRKAEIRDMLFEIITDEQAHATKLNFLYAKHH